ncbi:MAG: ATP-binding protein [Clostridium sp.]
MQADSYQMKTGHGQKKNFSKRCPLCDDTTWIEYRKNNRVCASRCQCFSSNKDNTNESWKRAGLTLETSKLNFTNFNEWNEKAIEMKNVATNYYKNFSAIKNTRENSIMFLGNPGSGKTHLCIAIANNLMKNRGVAVVYMPYREVIISIKQNIMDADSYSINLNRYKKVDVLLIDDLFKGQATKADVNIMFEIINYRYMNNLPMLISTELKIAELVDIDEAIASRVYEMAIGYTVAINSKESNYRFKGINKNTYK